LSWPSKRAESKEQYLFKVGWLADDRSIVKISLESGEPECTFKARRSKMLNLEVKTKLSVEEVTERLKKFFGKDGLGLQLAEEAAQCLTFEGGGGYVTATLCPEGAKTRVDLVTQEWDIKVKDFASRLP